MTTSPEKWKPISGWEGWYEVSDHGRVRSVDREITYPTYKTRVRGRVLRPDTTSNGTHRIYLQRNGHTERFSVPRIVAREFIGPAPTGKPWVLHWDDDRDNNHVSNLRWGDALENVHDAIRNGLHIGAATDCPRGHPYKLGNLVGSENGRRCKTCELESDRRRHFEKVRRGIPAGDPRHGTYAGYRAGCRCDGCSGANRTYKREYTRKRRGGHGSGN